jgi:hypothetical protein
MTFGIFRDLDSQVKPFLTNAVQRMQEELNRKGVTGCLYICVVSTDSDVEIDAVGAGDFLREKAAQKLDKLLLEFSEHLHAKEILHYSLSKLDLPENAP